MNLGQAKYQDLVLDAIDQLRRRKARPDAERIFNCLHRRNGISSIESKQALEQCVANGSVLRVCYKGNISYRNAARKFSHMKRVCPLLKHMPMKAKPMPGRQDSIGSKQSRKFTNLLTSAFAELVLQEPDYLDGGVPPADLIKTILEKDSVRYTKKYVCILLNKEVETGGLVRLDNGNFLVGPNKPVRMQNNNKYSGYNGFLDELIDVVDLEEEDIKLMKRREQMMQTERYMNGSAANGQSSQPARQHKKENSAGNNETLMETSSDNPEMTRNENLRVGSRRKKAKKVFDPSDSNMPKRPRGRPSLNFAARAEKLAKFSDSDSRPESRTSQNGREQGGVCSVCHNQSKKTLSDKMVSCRECSTKAHVTCLNGDDMMLKMYPDNTWQCPHCKTCVVCFQTAAATTGSLVVCSICADAYHTACHTPKLEKLKPGTKFLCNNCEMSEQLAVDNIQIGYNMDINKKVKVEKSESLSPTRSSSPDCIFPFPPSPTLPTLSPQTNNGRGQSPSFCDSKSDTQSLKDEDLDDPIDPSIPDATNWSSEDVSRYFEQYFPEEAQVFRDQEIDGHCLLLMKRMDVLKGLHLKLGPALKIYRHVLKLQHRRDDPKLYWV